MNEIYIEPKNSGKTNKCEYYVSELLKQNNTVLFINASTSIMTFYNNYKGYKPVHCYIGSRAYIDIPIIIIDEYELLSDNDKQYISGLVNYNKENDVKFYIRTSCSPEQIQKIKYYRKLSKVLEKLDIDSEEYTLLCNELSDEAHQMLSSLYCAPNTKIMVTNYTEEEI